MKKIIFTLYTLCFAISVLAYDFEVDGLYYNIINDSYIVEVSRNENYSNLIDVVIPDSVNFSNKTYAVKGIAKEAFRCSSLKSISIPETMNYIGYAAFEYCYNLESIVWNAINFDDSQSAGSPFYNTGSNISSFIFGNKVKIIPAFLCYQMKSLSEITIPSSVTKIGKYAFSYTNIKTIIIPENVTNIEKSTFYNCSSLTTIHIPNNIINIESGAFQFCSSLRTIILGDNVEEIGSQAFYACNSLTNIHIPDKVKSIGYYAFGNCSSLSSVTIGKGIKEIGVLAFGGCENLTETHYFGNIDGWCRINFASFNANPMAYSKNLYINNIELVGEIIIPNSVDTIGKYTFNYCKGITSLIISNNVTCIKEEAFKGCESLDFVEIGESIIEIGKGVFDACPSISSIAWNPKSYPDFEEEGVLFGTVGEANITSVKFGKDVKHIPAYLCAFMPISTVDIPNSVETIGEYAFAWCENLDTINLGSSLTIIPEGAFRGSYNIKTIKIPNSVKTIGKSAFESCVGLTTIEIPDSVTIIEEAAFNECSELSSLTIGESVTSIGAYAFAECDGLVNLTLPKAVTSIGDFAFQCPALAELSCYANTPPVLGIDVFYEVNKDIPVYVCDSIESYKSAYGWNQFSRIVELEVQFSISVSSNDEKMGFAKVDYNTYCGNQISAIPNEGYRFVSWNDGNTDNPRSIDLTQDTILTAEFSLIKNGQCGELLYWSYDEVNKELFVTGEGNMYRYTTDPQPWAFFKEQIMKVTFSNTTKSIGESAFEGCIRLMEIKLGNGLENIEDYAFAGCNRLYYIYSYAVYPPFAQQSSFTNYDVYLHIPCESMEWYKLDVIWGNFKYIECLNDETAIKDVITNDDNIQKLLRNNQLLIFRDGKIYNVMGQEM